MTHFIVWSDIVIAIHGFKGHDNSLKTFPVSVVHGKQNMQLSEGKWYLLSWLSQTLQFFHLCEGAELICSLFMHGSYLAVVLKCDAIYLYTM